MNKYDQYSIEIYIIQSQNIFNCNIYSNSNEALLLVLAAPLYIAAVARSGSQCRAPAPVFASEHPDRCHMCSAGRCLEP